MEANLIFYVLNTAISVLVALVGLRFLLQLAQANFYNPISQGINRFTAPLTGVFSSLPTIGSFNTGILVSAIVIQALGAGLCPLSPRRHPRHWTTHRLVNPVGLWRDDQSRFLRITWHDYPVLVGSRSLASWCRIVVPSVRTIFGSLPEDRS